MNPLANIKAWFGGRFAEQVMPSPDRSQMMFWLPEDTMMHLDPYTRSELNRKVDWLYQNFGIVKEGVAGIRRHTVGKGIALQCDSSDSEWNDLAEEDFERYALTADRCDVAGRRNFYELQECAVEQRLLRGEFLAAMGRNPRWDGAPAVRVYDAGEIESPDDAQHNDRIYDGVEVDRDKLATRYWVRTAVGGHQPVPAAAMLHWYRAIGVNQVRGESEFAQSVNRLADIHDLIKLTARSAKLHAAMALMVKRATGSGGKQGAIGKMLKGRAPAGAADNQERLERVFGGAAIAYVGSEDDLKLITSSSPSPLVEPFVTDLLMRDVCAAWGVPAEFFWAVAKLSGANTRFILARADLFFQTLADSLIFRFCVPVATRYLWHRMQTGALRECRDPRWAEKLNWQTPARITVDNGRDGELEMRQLDYAIVTYRDLQDKRGRAWRPQLRQWFREWATARKMAEEEGAEDALAFWRPGMPGAAGVGQDKEPDRGSKGGAGDDDDGGEGN